MKDPLPSAFAQTAFSSAPSGWAGLAPERVLQAFDLGSVIPVLQEVERLVESEGYSAIGFVGYEAASALDAALVTHPAKAGIPLLWFGLARAEQSLAPDAPFGNNPNPPDGGNGQAFAASLPRESYRDSISLIKKRIAAGDTYQVNFTFPLVKTFGGDRSALARLMRAQPTRHGAVTLTEQWAIASASPELFFRLDGDRIEMRPMKGTRPRGRYTAEDEGIRAELLASTKDRAENVMIVDMVRNDLGRVCRTGSVSVPRLFQAERYPSVWQMTSTVEGRCAAGLVDLFRALFPCASVTGAPKVNTMRIIRELETVPRGVYTGAIGMLRPGRRYEFNVAIRTLALESQANQAVYGVGSGVVWDSVADQEYEECLHKAAVLHDSGTKPDLLETLRWRPGEGVWLRERHLLRLTRSAAFFGYADPLPAATRLLDSVQATEPLRLRLTVNATGQATLSTAPLPSAGTPLRVRLDTCPTGSHDRFLFHKTLHRLPYEAARARHPDVDDVLLWNERGELTESTIANLAIKLEGHWYTPPQSSGLLAGTFREELLESGECRERILRPADLFKAEEWILINSVRGRIQAILVP